MHTWLEKAHGWLVLLIASRSLVRYIVTCQPLERRGFSFKMHSAFEKDMSPKKSRKSILRKLGSCIWPTQLHIAFTTSLSILCFMIISSFYWLTSLTSIKVFSRVFLHLFLSIPSYSFFFNCYYEAYSRCQSLLLPAKELMSR